MKRCSNCGKITDSHYCPDCGNDMIICKELMICPVCGSEVESKFCPDCGYDMAETQNEQDSLGKKENIISEKTDIVRDNEPLYTEISNNEDKTVKLDNLDESTEGERNHDSSQGNINQSQQTEGVSPISEKIHQKTEFVILMLILFFPIGVFFMWKHKKFKKVIRIILSIILGLWFLLCAFVGVALLIPCEHENTDTYTYDKPTLTETGLEVEYCIDCDEDLDSWDIDVKEPKVDETSFNFTDEEFIEWFENESVLEFELIETENSNSIYKIINTNTDKNGVLFLNHGGNDVDDNISLIAMYFSDDDIAAMTLVTYIGEQIDSDFSGKDALTKLYYDQTYSNADMTSTMLELYDGGNYAVIAPTKFFEEILE